MIPVAQIAAGRLYKPGLSLGTGGKRFVIVKENKCRAVLSRHVWYVCSTPSKDVYTFSWINPSHVMYNTNLNHQTPCSIIKSGPLLTKAPWRCRDARVRPAASPSRLEPSRPNPGGCAPGSSKKRRMDSYNAVLQCAHVPAMSESTSTGSGRVRWSNPWILVMCRFQLSLRGKALPPLLE